MKKRIFTIVTMLIMCVALCGCGGEVKGSGDITIKPLPELETSKINDDSVETTIYSTTQTHEESEINNVYIIKSIEINLSPRESKSVDFESVMVRKFRLGINKESVVAGDLRARECIKPILITDFSRIDKIEYENPTLIDISKFEGSRIIF